MDKSIIKKIVSPSTKNHSEHTASVSLYSLFKNHTANFTMSRTERLSEPHRRSQKKNRRLLVLSLRGGGISYRYIKIYRCSAIIDKGFYIFPYGVGNYQKLTRVKLVSVSFLWGGNHSPLKMLFYSYSGLSYKPESLITTASP